MIQHILIANRGEVALRIAQAAADMGLQSTAVFAAGEGAAAHRSGATHTVALGASGPAAFLDIKRQVALAHDAGCDAVHPGYGFLSERADFAQACADAGLIFIGPTAAQLATLGDKARALALARNCGVPVLAGSTQAVSLPEAQAFMAASGGAGVMLKAVGGGGGRGLRAVHRAGDLPEAFARCASEALAAFGQARCMSSDCCRTPATSRFRSSATVSSS